MEGIEGFKPAELMQDTELFGSPGLDAEEKKKKNMCNPTGI